MKSKKGSAQVGGQQQDLFSWAASHASLTPQQESASEARMVAISGQKLSELLASAGPTQSFLKMFLALEAFSTRRCTLKWKQVRLTRYVEKTLALSMNGRSVKKWKSNSRSFSSESWPGFCKTLKKQDIASQRRLTGVQSFYLFRLQVSALPTSATGSGLLPTPDAALGDGGGKVTSMEFVSDTGIDSRNGKKRQISLKDKLRRDGLLKTPTAMDGLVGSGKKNPKPGDSGTLAQEVMSGYGPTMEKLGLSPTPTSSMATTQDFVQAKYAFKNRPEYSDSLLVPTPRASEAKGTRPLGSKSHNHRVERGYLDATMQEATGTSGPLSHQFTLEMMGFPTDWIIAAFSRE